MNLKFSDKVFYHIYALGLGGCSKKNDFACPAGNFFEVLSSELDDIKNNGFNAILIGPVFESSAHGYDTVDYYHIDRRLGNNEKFKNFCKLCKEKNISIVLDAVFNHTGRDFFAFKDIQQNGGGSQYKNWYLNLNFDRRSNYGDCFDYDGWAGCKDLVKLNVDNPKVQEHLFSAVKFWIEEFGIDGLRLDAADVLSKNFLDELSKFSRSIKNDFWLMGEVVHGDYNEWCCNNRLDSVTNYQIYKALWSSLNDQNFYELSYNLEREFNTDEGIYNNFLLYNFVDNHDVNRAGSVLQNPEKHIALLYELLYSIPGIPSVYYGSENGIRGVRSEYGDYELRPSLPPFSTMPDFAKPQFDCRFLKNHIAKLGQIRKENSALQNGSFRKEFISNRQFVFWRENVNQKILVAANSDFVNASVKLENIPDGEWKELLSEKYFSSEQLRNIEIKACSAMILAKVN